jgi:predicted RNA methylase
MFSSSISHFGRNVYRPFSPSSSRWSKTIEDFIDARDAPQLYLTHYLGFKGKSFPRMIRAILNYLQPREVVLDPFCGAGTVNLEAILLHHDTIGVDMQPLFTRLVRAKMDSLSWDFLDLERKITELITKIEFTTGEMGKYIGRPEFDVYLPPTLLKKSNQESLQMVRSILGSIQEIDNEDYRSFCTLAVAYWARSMLRKQSPAKILETFKERLWSMYFAVRYFGKFQSEVTKINLGKAAVFTGDVRCLEPDVQKGLSILGRTKISDIITSPPYGTAIDYVGDNVYALYLLGKQLFSVKEGILDAALLCISYQAIFYSQEARSFSLFLRTLGHRFWGAYCDCGIHSARSSRKKTLDR